VGAAPPHTLASCGFASLDVWLLFSVNSHSALYLLTYVVMLKLKLKNTFLERHKTKVG